MLEPFKSGDGSQSISRDHFSVYSSCKILDIMLTILVIKENASHDIKIARDFF